MSSQTVALVLVLALVLVYFAIRRARAQKPGPSGDTPPQPETFLYFDSGRPQLSPKEASGVAEALGASVASASDVSHYVMLGGSAAGFGLVRSGGVLGAPGFVYNPQGGPVPPPCPGAHRGVGLVGVKPPPQTPRVVPFSCERWGAPPHAPKAGGS